MVMARDDDVETLCRARDLCEEALTYRSPERNVEDWAYSLVNRGAALERLVALGEATRAEAEAAYRAVVEHADELPPEVAGHAKLNLLVLLMGDVDEGDDEAPPDDATLSALTDRAMNLAHDAAIPPVTRGRAMLRLARLQRRRGAANEAAAAWSAALLLLTGADLRGVRDAGWELGATLAELGRSDDAAVAYRAALDATESLISGPRDVADRAQHTAAVNRLPRRAAHAFVACGSLEEAVVTLENGRTRELRRQLQLEDPQLAELKRFVPHAVADWREAAAQLAAEGADLDAAGAALDDALARIRAVPRFERFGLGAELRTVQAAAAEGVPVVYINPAPEGTTLLRIDATGRIDARPLPLTSVDIVLRVLFGIAPDDDISEPISYTLAAAGGPADVEDDRDRPDIAEALDRLLPWIGEEIAAPIDDLLAGHGDVGAVLIAFGPQASVPLVAARFDGDRTLLDLYAVSTTPSATAHAAARRRAAAVENPLATLVAIADPTDDLDFARVEVDQLSIHFDTARIGAGAAGTSTWLSQHAEEATSVHLACHGFGGMVDATESGLVLADGILPGAEVARLPLGQARLAVASACQSGVTEIGDLADEAFSLGAALLGAGAACAIASLSSVDDLATAVLMTRFYEHLADGKAPAAALGGGAAMAPRIRPRRHRRVPCAAPDPRRRTRAQHSAAIGRRRPWHTGARVLAPRLLGRVRRARGLTSSPTDSQQTGGWLPSAATMASTPASAGLAAGRARRPFRTIRPRRAGAYTRRISTAFVRAPSGLDPRNLLRILTSGVLRKLGLPPPPTSGHSPYTATPSGTVTCRPTGRPGAPPAAGTRRCSPERS
jgi:tetratricopeptide (TPR) repeat protein